MKRLPVLLAPLVALLLGACQAKEEHVHIRENPARPNPWTRLVLNNNPDDFHFAIVADRTGRVRAGVFESALPKINLLQPEFVMSVGDMIKGYTEDEALLNQQWDEVQKAIATLEMPFFYIPGNHDITNAVQAKHWEKRFGRSYYHFVYRDVLFLCCNSEDPPYQNMSEEQVAYMAQALKENPNVRWTLVFMHQPLWVSTKKTAWPKLEALLKNRRHTVFAGHVHAYTKYVRNDSKYIVLATTGGGLKEDLPHPRLGSFDHITWITMKNDGPRIVHLQLEGIFDENVRTEAGAALVDHVLRGRVLSIDPVFSQGSFRSGGTRIRLGNPTPNPAHIKGAFRKHPEFTVEPATVDAALAPGATREIELALRSDKDPSSPLILDWEIAYEVPDNEPLKMQRSSMIVPTPRYQSVERKKPVTIDANLEEWGDLPLACESPVTFPAASPWKGPEDLSCRFAVQHDAEHLYVAVRTKDDVAVHGIKAEPTQQDTLEVRLDARSEPQRSLGRELHDPRESLLISVSPGKSPTDSTIHFAENLPPGTKIAMRRLDDGYAAEIAIPAAYLNDKQGKAWEAFRLNVLALDLDEPRTPPKRLWFQPEWRSKANITGSGTFDRK